jgi:hypothetical protein
LYVENKPVGNGDHEVIGMGSFGEYTGIRLLPVTRATDI